MNPIVYSMVYLAAGMTLKLGDDLLDELERGDLAWLPLAVSGVLFGVIMANSEWDLVLMTGIVMGVLLSGKVNHVQFAAGFVMIVLSLLVLGVPVITDWAGWSAMLIMLLMAAMLDERGLDWTDRHQFPVAYWFFELRFTLKISAILLAIPWPMFLPSAIGLWIFDAGYECVGFFIRHRYSMN